jgi:uncharacterized membrane protein YjfL (UPF0719 family)
MRVVVAFFEFFISALVSVAVVYVMYRVFVITNKDYDGEEEIEKGNVAVAILTVGIMISAAGFVQYGLDAVERMFLLYMTTPVHEAFGGLRMAAYGAAHLVVSFFFAVFTIILSLRLFGKLCSRMHLGDELKKGNVAVGILLAGVVFVVCLFVKDGVGSLSKALLPQPSIGRVQIMK